MPELTVDDIVINNRAERLSFAADGDLVAIARDFVDDQSAVLEGGGCAAGDGGNCVVDVLVQMMSREVDKLLDADPYLLDREADNFGLQCNRGPVSRALGRFGEYRVGTGTYNAFGPYGPYTRDCLGTSVRIGNFCSLAKHISFLTCGHEVTQPTTYPFARAPASAFASAYTSAAPYRGEYTKGDIVVGHDVWIGWGATILSGVTIGDLPRGSRRWKLWPPRPPLA